MAALTCRQIEMDLAAQLRRPCTPQEPVNVWWLGQAGFFISGAGVNLLIDPYLSEHLAKKYRGREFDHVRLMPAPMHPADATAVDYVLCTHRHGDHMDPEGLPAIMKASTECRLIAPIAEQQAVRSMIPASLRTILVNAGDVVAVGEQAWVQVIASAHEDLRMNSHGEHHYLGYVLGLGGLRIYHSGDCVPYPGLVECLCHHRIDVALLPINGRDPYRASHGVPGNFTFEEAVDLTIGADIPLMICHHFGMFRFNTIAQNLIRQHIEVMGLNSRVLVPRIGVGYQLRPGTPCVI